MAGAGGGCDASQCQRCSGPFQGGEFTVHRTFSNAQISAYSNYQVVHRSYTTEFFFMCEYKCELMKAERLSVVVLAGLC